MTVDPLPVDPLPVDPLPVDPLGELVMTRSITICCGSGGVGKTTTSAVLALEAARRGRRAVVVTIDPAKRLADALGLAGGLSNTPKRIEGDWPGELWAVMLDTKTTFDELVTRYAPDPDQAARILANRFYRNISGALSGTQEYMAAEKLHQLHDEGDWDLVVVDTPPTRNALDFLDAPDRLIRFLDHRLYRVLTAPTRAYLRAVGMAASAFLRSMARVVGSEVLGDAIAFFRAFDGMEAGFRARAERVRALLGDAASAYVLVAAPRRDAVEEATYFARRLTESGVPIAVLIVNRVHPRFGTVSAAEAVRRAETAPPEVAPLWTNLAELTELADREDEQLASLTARVAPAPVVRVPFLPDDVHDVSGLNAIASHLFPA